MIKIVKTDNSNGAKNKVKNDNKQKLGAWSVSCYLLAFLLLLCSQKIID